MKYILYKIFNMDMYVRDGRERGVLATASGENMYFL
jgi:hypothetical protein